VTVGYDEIIFVESSFLEVGEDPIPGLFMFCISNAESKDLSVAIRSYTGYNIKHFADIPDPLSYFKYKASTNKNGT